MTFIYKSYADLARDLRHWADTLPPFSAVCGVPRSGIACANFLAQHWNIPQVPIEHLLEGTPSFRPSCSRRIHLTDGPVLLIDDTCWAGRTMREIRARLKRRKQVKFGAVYVSDSSRQLVDHCGYVLPHVHHGFQWNLLANSHCGSACVDMDGVLCHDWGRPDNGGWLSEYERFLREARPFLRPTLPLYAIVTSRLKKYEPQTVDWLRRHGIRFRRLIMSPYRSPRERAQNQGFADWKAAVYAKLFSSAPEGAGPRFFLESHCNQAERIAALTGLVTISYDTHECWNGTDGTPTFDRSPISNIRIPS